MTGPALEVHAADWPAPRTVRALTTLRAGGVSTGACASFNLAAHVGDDPAAVECNRARLRSALGLPDEPLWLAQVHGREVVAHPGIGRLPLAPPVADASVTREPGAVLAVLTADCLPVVLASRDGAAVGVAHAGWRGLAGGVLQATVAALACPPGDLVAWLGPAIEPAAFEVGDEVREAFCEQDPGAGACFAANDRGRWQADLAGLARRVLARAGVGAVHGRSPGTYGDARCWYSHRRDPRSGRMATLAWIAPP